MGIRNILLPYNFTANDKKALDFVVDTFAGKQDVKIILFHTYIPTPDVDLSANPEMNKMAKGLAFLSSELNKKETGLESIKSHLLKNGFVDNQVEYIFKARKKSIADEIIESASDRDCRILVFGSQSGKVSRMFARSVHEKVLSVLKDVTVCIAT